jgi:mono/diheme cytochrome c family protein
MIGAWKHGSLPPSVLLLLAAWLGVGASVAFGRQSGTGNARQFHAALRDVPAKAQARPNPMESEPDAVAAGGKLFEMHCAECHGKKAEGTRRAPSLLRREMQNATPGAIFWVLTNGVVRRGMPVWSKLPEPERWQIVAFLKSFKAEQKESGGGQ